MRSATIGTDDNHRVMEVNEEEMTDTDMDVASELIDRSPIKSVVS